MYKPTEGIQKVFQQLQVAETWWALRSQPPPMNDLETRQVGLAEFESKYRIIYEFLLAIAPISPQFYEYWMCRIQIHDYEGTDLPDFFYVVNRCIDFISIVPPSKNGTRSGHATSQSRGQNEQTKKKRCPCESDPDDGLHKFGGCYYVNPSIRPSGWKPRKEAEERFQRACRNIRFKHAYNKAIKEHQQKNDATKEKKHIVLSPFISKDQINAMLDPKPEMANSVQTKESKKARKNDVWCYSTGAAVHVCNNRDLLSDYRPSAASVRIGDTETDVLGFGSAVVRPTESLDGTPLRLINVAYAPGFHLNLISASLGQNAGIYHSGLDGVLEGADRTAICRLNRKSGIYLVKWDQSTSDGAPPGLHQGKRRFITMSVLCGSTRSPSCASAGKTNGQG
ncbi:hypothetical protein N7535_003550 [Penicillium sp. DV-2018c]|nr:hypothetical protein N7461_000748 [Penicillium sp. DV-2018c]KAJ5576624.1 hypothetical protein N7535_003550 [Penicillium sp. DV-2018c]